MKIVVVSQYFRPEDAKIPNGVAAELQRRGHDVRVVTGFPNYPDGKLFAGYRQRLRGSRIEHGIEVCRVPLVISHSQSALGRLASYVSFGLSSSLAARQLRNADVVYVYATQMTAAIGPHIWKAVRRLPFVLHVQDVWPESITESSMVRNPFVKRLIARTLTPWLSRVYKSSAATIAIAPSMRELLISRGCLAATTHTVFNWADEDTVRLVPPRRNPARLSVVYAGNIGPLQDLETAIAAAKLVSDLPGFELIIVGSGIDEARLRDSSVSAPNVTVKGRVPIADMGAIYSASDFQLVSLRNLPIFEGTIPSKLQGSLAAGVPVICSVPGDAGKLVSDNRVGFTAKAEDAASLANAFRGAYALSQADYSAMCERSRNFYVDAMSMDNGITRIEEILYSAAKR